MARNEQLIRQHKILQVLERLRFGATLEELRDAIVDELGLTSLHTRSVRRDLEALMAAGLPIIDEESPRGRIWKLSRADKGLHKLTITASELIALSMGRDLMLPLVGTQFWIGIESFWNKVRESLPQGVWEHYERYRKALYVFGTPSKSYERQEGMLKTINRAIVEHRVVEIEYEAVGRPVSKRRIEPYGVAVYQSSIYVVAAAPDVSDPSERLRNWKLDRFRHATALDDYFKPDPNIDLSAHLGKSIGIFSGETATDVKIRLSERASAWVREDPWHPEQSIEPDKSGDLILTVPASHPREVLPKVLSLGADAELLSPAEFRSAVAEAVAGMAQHYEAAKS